MLFFGRALMIGLVAAGIGYALGTFIAISYGPELFPVTAKAIHAQPNLLAWAIGLTPLMGR